MDLIRDLVGAMAGRLFVADYSLRFLQQVDINGPQGSAHPITGTLIGRAFSSGQLMVTEGEPTTVSVPLTDGTDRIGLLELDFDDWDDQTTALLEPLVSLFVMILVTKSRYTDLWLRARRSQPLSAAAEIQWDLLPPLACSTPEVALGGILEPAYSIGGDSFDYAFNDRRLDFAIVDAIGHGLSAVSMSTAAINGLRNARRAGLDLSDTYGWVDQLISAQFGHSFYVTGQFGSLDVDTGEMRWLNAGHVSPMLVRNGSYAGELVCAPSMPMGLGGRVVNVASEPLQRGDRVLFYTDGITESRSADGAFFGIERLADFLVRATL
ncbi:MAG: Protein serine/threonine phosphatase, partial [Ilumatobacteraceae bacterium]|nr:Protein serine/threonine phosphatase [Ilumatobacteraceae bacterium]